MVNYGAKTGFWKGKLDYNTQLNVVEHELILVVENQTACVSPERKEKSHFYLQKKYEMHMHCTYKLELDH